MKKTTIILSLAALSIVCISAGVKYSGGSATQYTDSPIDGAGDCSNCHGGGTVTPVIHISAVPAFGAGNTYQPGMTYTISYNITGYPYFGLDLEIISSQSTTAASDAGTFVSTVSNCKFTPSTGPAVPTNVTHTGPIPTASSASFKWKAPTSGTVYIYTCGIGANGNGKTSGDQSVNTLLTLNLSPLGVINSTASTVNLNVFPNPACSEIHLRYSLEKESQVGVKIYDLSGKMVADLLNETLPSGEQTFDSSVPSSLSKGIYTLQLLVDGSPVVKKLVIR